MVTIKLLIYLSEIHQSIAGHETKLNCETATDSAKSINLPILIISHMAQTVCSGFFITIWNVNESIWKMTWKLHSFKLVFSSSRPHDFSPECLSSNINSNTFWSNGTHDSLKTHQMSAGGHVEVMSCSKHTCQTSDAICILFSAPKSNFIIKFIASFNRTWSLREQKAN